MDMSNPYREGGGNTFLKVATCGGVPEAVRRDDILEATGVRYSYPKDFQTVLNAEAVLNGDMSNATDSFKKIPQWIANSSSLEDKNSRGDQNPINYGKDIRLVDQFHKQPTTRVHSMDETATISQGGVLDQDKFTPTYPSGFKAYGGAPQQAGKHTTPGRADPSKVS
jgi:hypothetical protein